MVRMSKRLAYITRSRKRAFRSGRKPHEKKAPKKMDWLRGRGFWGSPPGNTSDGSQAPANRPPGAEDSNERRQLLRNSSAGIGAMGAKQSQENQGCQVSPVEACSSSSGASGAPTTSSTGGNKSTSTTGGLRISGIVTREIRGDRRNPESLMSTIEVRCPRQSILPRSVSSAHPQTVNTGVDDYLKPDRFEHLLRKGPPDQHVQEQHSWNPEDRSLNIFVKDEDKFTFHRHPVAQSTDCIRGKIGYSRGFHVWQIEWPERQRGTHAVVGVATKAAPLHAVGYTALVGTTNESYGWDITRRQCHHDSKHTETWRYPYNVPSTYNVPDKFYCILDMDEGYMAFSTEDRYLGVAFRNLKGKTLYPIVAAVWGHCEISMRYLGSLEREPLPPPLFASPVYRQRSPTLPFSPYSDLARIFSFYDLCDTAYAFEAPRTWQKFEDVERRADERLPPHLVGSLSPLFGPSLDDLSSSTDNEFHV